MTVPARQRLIVALDGNREENERLVDHLGASVSFYKLGAVSLLSGGQPLLERLLGDGKDVFIDFKLFDIPNTVGQSIGRLSDMGVRFATVHGNQQIVRAALDNRGTAKLQILAVTMLTSLIAQDAQQLYGLPDGMTLRDYVLRTITWLLEWGCDGVVASSEEISAIRTLSRELGRDLTIVTPGIRMPDDDRSDQRRVGTPYDAITSGADYLVVGRPIRHADRPAEKAELIVREIDRGLADRE